MKLIKGDLLKAFKNGEFDVIAHGCNCFCNMGSGIARSIRAEWPGVYNIDCSTVKGSTDKLGSITLYKPSEATYIVNCYTQYYYGRNKVHADYKAIKSCMSILNRLFKGQRVGLPKIGCGLAGGDWNVVEFIMAEELTDVDLTIMWI